MRRLTLRSKILFYLLVVSLFGIFLTSFSILWGFEDQFNEYLQINIEERSSLIEDEAIESYKETGKLIDNRLINLMHQQAMTDNLFYRITNEEGQVIIDTTMMPGKMKRMRMHSDSDIDLKTEYRKNTYDLTFDEKYLGKMEVYYPDEMIGEDIAFFNTIKSNIYLAIIVTVVLAFVFSLLFSKRLTTGYRKLSKAIQELQDHKWRIRVSVEELSDEMKPLGESFNRLAESLSKEEILRKQFTADFAHEIRTPLATLRSQLEAFQDGVFEPTPKRLQQSHDELMRLVRLVDELEELLAAENPQIKLNKSNIDVGHLLRLLDGQFAPAFQEKGVSLNIQKPTKEYWLHADQDCVLQVLTNIINNALQYTPQGNNVYVKVVDSNDYIGFCIQDEGIGIKEDDLPYLFERFYRGDKSRDRKTGGIGIGLSIVKALMDAHHGKIQIESKWKEGTEITVIFPKHETL